MQDFMTSTVTTKADAIREVTLLTGMCAAMIRAIPATKSEKVKAATLARFKELNETRCGIIEAWGLQAFAAGLIAK